MTCYSECSHEIIRLNRRINNCEIDICYSAGKKLVNQCGLSVLSFVNTLDATRHLSGVRTYSPHTPRALSGA